MGNELPLDIGRKIKEIRTSKGLTVRQLADLTEVDPGFLGHLEAGRKLPGVRTLIKVAHGLGVEPGHLLVKSSPAEKVQELDAAAMEQLRALLARRTPSEKRSLIALLKLISDPRRAEGLRAALRR